MPKPLLSIGIIFKNDIRCLERCMKSLQPLRDAVHCELVMADTGSEDGSREVAEQYADILFDFPWINDFAAARNAVMDRCSGKWYLTVDSDEWLDEDISQLTRWLNGSIRGINACGVIQRNYHSYTDRDGYSDMMASRMVRMSTGERYHGAIHEVFHIPSKAKYPLSRTILHHDGYVGLGGSQGMAKRKRNMDLLREELKQKPDDVRTRLLCMDSSVGDSDHENYVRLAVDGVKQKLPGWKSFGPVILRSAAKWAARFNKEEFDAFAQDARSMFPDAIATRLDVEHLACMISFGDKDYEKAISAGEAYLRGMEDYHAGRCDLSDMMFSSLESISPLKENQARLALAESYFQTGDFQKSLEHLTTVEFDKLSDANFKNCVGVMMNLQAQSGLEMSGQMARLWDYWEALEEDDPARKQRKGALISAAAAVFPQSYRDAETEKGYRHAYTVFLPLAGKLETGTAARILEATDPGELERLLGDVRDWKELPIHALAHALKNGALFPLPDKPLQIEEMDGLAGRLAADKEHFFPLARGILAESFEANAQTLLWARGLSMAAIQAFDWKAKRADVDTGLSVVRDFIRTEEAFLPFCFAAQALREENLSALPPMHRFGWYCVQAFEALDSGDAVGYVQLLRTGLGVCSTVKDMVEFLVEHTPELQVQPEPSAELIALAEQLRSVLANFAPDDPSVAVLKQSEAYQKVAYLIEGASAPIAGGLLQ